MFCEGCREELVINASIIKRQIESSKHKTGKERLAQRKKREISIEEAMKKYYQDVHPVGELMGDNTACL